METIKDLEVIDYSHKGQGIAKHDDKVFFIEEALVGEIVDVEINYVNKNIFYANIAEIKKKSNNRINPICKHYNECGGCNIMHMNYEEQLFFKKRVAFNLLKKNNIGLGFNTINIVENPTELGYRNKVTSAFLIVDDVLALGFNKKLSSDVIKVDYCHLISENMNNIWNDILKILNNQKKIPFSTFNKLTIRENDQGNIMIIFDLNNIDDSLVKHFTNLFEEYLKGHSEIDVFDIRYGKKNINLLSSVFIYNLKDKRFFIGSESFFQVNTLQTINIYDKVKALISESSENVLDLYSGVGSIGIYAKNEEQSLYSVEVIKEAVKMGKLNSQENGLKDAHFLCLNLERDIQKLKDMGRLSFDTMILDPPRKGISKKLIHTIVKIKPKEIIYISCSLQTLIRDIKILESEYGLEYFNLYDMFSQTTHIEAVVKMGLKWK